MAGVGLEGSDEFVDDLRRYDIEFRKANLDPIIHVDDPGVRGLPARIPYDDGAFDFVFCTEALEHMLDPLVCLREIYRVLAPRGGFLMTTPNLARAANRFKLLWGTSISFPLHQSIMYNKGNWRPHMREYTLEELRAPVPGRGLLPAARPVPRHLGRRRPALRERRPAHAPPEGGAEAVPAHPVLAPHDPVGDAEVAPGGATPHPPALAEDHGGPLEPAPPPLRADGRADRGRRPPAGGGPAPEQDLRPARLGAPRLAARAGGPRVRRRPGPAPPEGVGVRPGGVRAPEAPLSLPGGGRPRTRIREPSRSSSSWRAGSAPWWRPTSTRESSASRKRTPGCSGTRRPSRPSRTTGTACRCGGWTRPASTTGPSPSTWCSASRPSSTSDRAGCSGRASPRSAGCSGRAGWRS